MCERLSEFHARTTQCMYDGRITCVVSIEETRLIELIPPMQLCALQLVSIVLCVLYRVLYRVWRIDE